MLKYRENIFVFHDVWNTYHGKWLNSIYVHQPRTNIWHLLCRVKIYSIFHSKRKSNFHLILQSRKTVQIVYQYLNLLYVIERSSKHDAFWFVRGGVGPRVFIRLPSILMFFLFCIIVKHKNTFPVVTIWNPGKKATNERASGYDIPVAFSFSSVSSKTETINGHGLECG
jgi:hypothetical protein